MDSRLKERLLGEQPPSLVAAHEAVDTINKLEKKIKELEEENFRVNAQTCEHLIGDEYGHETCKFREDERKATAALIYLAGKLSTPDKLSTTWIQEALKIGDSVLEEVKTGRE